MARLLRITRLKEMQLLDELPMIYAAASVIFLALGSSATHGWRKMAVIAGLVLICIFITTAYLFNLDPIFHQVSYGSLVCFVSVACLSCCRQGGQPL